MDLEEILSGRRYAPERLQAMTMAELEQHAARRRESLEGHLVACYPGMRDEWSRELAALEAELGRRRAASAPDRKPEQLSLF